MSKSKLEYHLFAKFPSNASSVRIGVFLSERACQQLGSEMHVFADEIFYKIKPRHPDTKPYRKPSYRSRLKSNDWLSTL